MRCFVEKVSLERLQILELLTLRQYYFVFTDAVISIVALDFLDRTVPSVFFDHGIDGWHDLTLQFTCPTLTLALLFELGVEFGTCFLKVGLRYIED